MRYEHARGLAVLVLASALLTLAALAHASPPDPTWLPGLYDDADYDDVVLLVTSSVGDLGAGPPTQIRPLPLLVGLIVASAVGTVPGTLLVRAETRAPPIA